MIMIELMIEFREDYDKAIYLYGHNWKFTRIFCILGGYFLVKIPLNIISTVIFNIIDQCSFNYSEWNEEFEFENILYDVVIHYGSISFQLLIEWRCWSEFHYSPIKILLYVNWKGFLISEPVKTMRIYEYFKKEANLFPSAQTVFFIRCYLIPTTTEISMQTLRSTRQHTFQYCSRLVFSCSFDSQR